MDIKNERIRYYLYIFSIDCFDVNYISPITTLITKFAESTNDKGKDNTTHKGKEYVFSYGWIKSHILLKKEILKNSNLYHESININDIVYKC